MPECPIRSTEERKGDRWEREVGKALKDWVTTVMQQNKTSRANSRQYVLERIRTITEETKKENS